ncbi:MAG: adenylate/guanylate cyclase domain-containing protein [Casimicrobiaceae bacterium]
MTEREQLEAAIASLQAQRALLGDAVVDAALGPMSARLDALLAQDQTLKQVTVLFVDVVGSTPLASQLSPETLGNVMDSTLQTCSDIIRAHGGAVMQYAGDSVMAAFGVGQAQEDDAERAVRCGLALIPVGVALNERVQREYGHAGADVRVGIHTGPVLLGGGERSAATIWGNTVHLAARMEQTAPPGRVRISQDTWRLVRGAFDVEEQPRLLAKGYPEALQTWLVLGARQRTFRAPARGIEGIETPMVGRSAELALLTKTFEVAAGDSALTMVNVVGDAGLGKSRLVNEFERWLEGRPQPTWIFRGRAHPQSLRQPYGVLRDVLCWRCEIQDSDTLEAAQVKLAQGLGPVFGERAEEQIALLGQLIGLDYRASPHIAGILSDARQLRARAFHAGVEYFRLLCAATRPAVLLLDDLHWADEGSLDFVEYLARNGAALPILVLCGTRPPLFERRPGWGGGLASQRRIDLAALGEDGRRALAAALLERIDDPPEGLRQLLIDGADGNPYYMEELTLMLIDDGVILTGTPRWQVVPDKLLTMHVPTTLTGVLQARIDGLAAPERRALQQASVIGPLFWDEALAQLNPEAPRSLPGLNLRQLVLGHETSAFEQTREFAFKHHLLHQATYDGVLERHKREQHHITALWLERRCAGRSSEYLSLLAEHFERAGVTEAAVRYWTQAADDAARRSADDTALAHTDRALALGGGTDAASRFSLINVREGVFGRRSARDAQIEAIAELERLAELTGDNVHRLQAAQRRAWFLFSTEGALLEALDVAQRALRWVGPAAGRDAPRVYNVMLGALARLGRFVEAREQGLAGLALARSIGEKNVEAHLLNNLGNVAMESGDLGAAAEVYEQATAAFREIGSRWGMAGTLGNLAQLSLSLGRPQQARDQLLENLRLCAEVGNPTAETSCQSRLAMAQLELGDAAGALESARAARQVAHAIGNRHYEAQAQIAMGDAHAALRRWDDAREQYAHAAETFTAMNMGLGAMDANAGLARVALALGDHATALRDVQAILDRSDKSQDWNSAFAVRWTCWRVLKACGDARADVVLDNAQADLCAAADKIRDATLRSSFLENVPAHREILAATQARHTSA